MGNVSHAVHNSVSSGHAGQKACTAYATKGKSSANINGAADAQKRNHDSAASVDVAKSGSGSESGSASSLNVAFPLDPHRSSARVVAKTGARSVALATTSRFLANRLAQSGSATMSAPPAAKTMTCGASAAATLDLAFTPRMKAWYRAATARAKCRAHVTAAKIGRTRLRRDAARAGSRARGGGARAADVPRAAEVSGEGEYGGDGGGGGDEERRVDGEIFRGCVSEETPRGVRHLVGARARVAGERVGGGAGGARPECEREFRGGHRGGEGLAGGEVGGERVRREGTARGGGTRRDVVGDVVVEVDALEHAVRGVRDGRRAEGNLAARPIVGIR